MDKEGFLYILRRIFEIEDILVGDSGTVYVNQPECFIAISEFIPCEEDPEKEQYFNHMS